MSLRKNIKGFKVVQIRGCVISDSQKYPDTDMLMTRNEAANYLRLKLQTLAVWAARGTGPKVCQVGRKALYRLGNLQEYIASCPSPHK